MTQNMPTQQVNMGKKPMYELQKYLEKAVKVKLKNMITYKGLLVKIDMYMNTYLQNAEEFDESEKVMASYGDVIIRGNNILYVEVDNSLLT
ncbi:MAG: LSM domain-containing protein [Conexivisphaerales archaeon]